MACETDKRLRRVHVSRMLPGKGERGEGAFFHFLFSVNVTLSPPGLIKGLRAAGGFMRLLLAVEWQALKERDEQ